MAAGIKLAVDDKIFECPVCLETLDDTCKMLPCQHTFCKQCLEVILGNNQRLQCLQCRMLVNVDIHELPRNYFLLNILERINSTQSNTRNEFAQDVITLEERKRILLSEKEKLENELKLLEMGDNDKNSSISSIEQNKSIKSPNDVEIASIINEDFNYIKRIMNDLNLGIDERNGQFSKNLAQLASKIDVEGCLFNLKAYHGLINNCLNILVKYHEKMNLPNENPDNPRNMATICTNGIENLEQVFRNISLSDEPAINVANDDVSERILQESKLAFIIDKLIETFKRLKEKIELRMALVMSQTNEEIANFCRSVRL